jgi:lipoprotein-releasing system permease protein
MKWIFALRYLLSRSSHSIINIIAGISVVSVAVPVAAMVILLSVFNGFESLVLNMYADVDADVEIRCIASGDTSHILEPNDENLCAITSIDGVSSASFAIEHLALAEYGSRQCVVRVRGVDERYFDVLPMDDYAVQGTTEVRLGEIERAVVSRDAASALGLYTTFGAQLKLYSLGSGQIGSMLPLRGVHSEHVEVGGIVRSTNIFQQTILLPLSTAQRLFGRERANVVFVGVKQGASPTAVTAQLRELTGKGVRVETRDEKNTVFYTVMRYEKWGIFFVSILVLIIASLSIIGTVIMLIVEKRDEQPALYAMGADEDFVRGIFVREGLLVSAIGGGVGLVLGVGITLAQQHLGLVRLPAGFMVEAYPVELQWLDVAIVFVTMIVVAWAVSLIATSTMIKTKRRKCDA